MNDKSQSTQDIFNEYDDTSWRVQLKKLKNTFLFVFSRVKNSRLLQLAFVCFVFGLLSSAYGLTRLLQDSHLICKEGDVLVAQSSNTYGSNSGDDFFTQSKLHGDQNNHAFFENKDSDLDLDKSVDFTSQHSIVDISGAVRNPGLYTVKKDARLGDVITEAGGLSTQANAKEIAQILNLATRVEDGQKIYIPFSGENIQSIKKLQNLAGEGVEVAQSSNSNGSITSNNIKNSDISESTNNSQVFESSATSNTKNQNNQDNFADDSAVSINSASSKELMELSGIGEKRAADIIAGRPYDEVGDLLSRGILGKALFESLESLLKL